MKTGDYHETSLKVAEIFDKRDEMKKDLDRVDAREAVFAENVKAKFGNQKTHVPARDRQ